MTNPPMLAATIENVDRLIREAMRYQGESPTPMRIHSQMSCILAALDLLTTMVADRDK